MSGAAPVLALAAGGTGGHMFPAQALAEEARARGWSVLLLTDARGMRFADGFPADEIVELRAANPNVRGPAAKIGMAWAMAGGTRQAGRSLRAARPFATVGFGGYPSAPAMFAAKAARLRHGIHEQNAVLGRVNRRVAPSADFVAHGFARLDRLGRVRGEVVQTGNPVRRAVRDAARPMGAIGDQANILVFGGSQGASLFSRVFPAALARLPTRLLRHSVMLLYARPRWRIVSCVKGVVASRLSRSQCEPLYARSLASYTHGSVCRGCE